jgi:hypothetical protein
MTPIDEKQAEDQVSKPAGPDKERPDENQKIKNPSGSTAYNYLYRDDYGYLDD